MNLINSSYSQGGNDECGCSHCQHCSCSYSQLTYSPSSSPDAYEKCLWESTLFRFATPDEQPWSSVAYLTDSRLQLTSSLPSFLSKRCEHESLHMCSSITKKLNTTKNGGDSARLDYIEHQMVVIKDLIISYEEAVNVPSIHKQYRRCSLNIVKSAFGQGNVSSENVNNNKVVVTAASVIPKNQVIQKAKCLNFVSVIIRNLCNLHRCRDINVFLPYHRYAKVKTIIQPSFIPCSSVVPIRCYQALTFSIVPSYHSFIQAHKCKPWTSAETQRSSSFLAELNRLSNLTKILPISRNSVHPHSLSLHLPKLTPTESLSNVRYNSSHRRHSGHIYRPGFSIRSAGNRRSHIPSYLHECLHNKYTQTDQVIIIPMRPVKKFTMERITPPALCLPSPVHRTRFSTKNNESRSKNNANNNITSSQLDSLFLEIFEDEGSQRDVNYQINEVGHISEFYTHKSSSGKTTIDELLTLMESTNVNSSSKSHHETGKQHERNSPLCHCQAVTYVDVNLEDDNRTMSPFLIPFLPNPQKRNRKP